MSIVFDNQENLLFLSSFFCRYNGRKANTFESDKTKDEIFLKHD